MQKTLRRKPNAPRKRRTSAARLPLWLILVPMDFSGYARQALTYAVPLARQNRAKISLVHVVRPATLSAWRAVPGGGHYLAMNMNNLVTVAKRHLDDLAIRLLPSAVYGKTIVREGTSANEIVATASALKADMIVLSSTRRSGLSRMLMGSTAERIVRHAPCSVLTVRRQRSGSAMRLLSLEKPLYPAGPPWKRILVPLDFSLTSLRTLKVVVSLAKQSGARLLLLHVVEPNPYPAGMEGGVLMMSDAVIARNAKQQLAQVTRRFVRKSVRTTSLVRLGHAADAIVETAEQKAADLIVLSPQGHSGLDQLFIGSTAEQVVRRAKCPVLVARKSHDLRHPKKWTISNNQTERERTGHGNKL